MDRIITTDLMEEDIKIENNLRPQLLEDYIGQKKAKDNLKIFIVYYFVGNYNVKSRR